MSDTPRTDANEIDALTLDISGQQVTDKVVRSIVVRKLERELAEKVRNEQEYERILGPRSYNELAGMIAEKEALAQKYYSILREIADDKDFAIDQRGFRDWAVNFILIKITT